MAASEQGKWRAVQNVHREYAEVYRKITSSRYYRLPALMMNVNVIARFSASLRATATGNFESKGFDKVGEVSG